MWLLFLDLQICCWNSEFQVCLLVFILCYSLKFCYLEFFPLCVCVFLNTFELKYWIIYFSLITSICYIYICVCVLVAFDSIFISFCTQTIDLCLVYVCVYFDLLGIFVCSRFPRSRSVLVSVCCCWKKINIHIAVFFHLKLNVSNHGNHCSIKWTMFSLLVTFFFGKLNDFQ